MTGFGDMKNRGPSPDPAPSNQEMFEAAVNFIFPDSPSSRLARACGNVAQRTAQKWIRDEITPPADVIDYVYGQKAELERTAFYDRVEALIVEHAAGLDGEVVAAQLSRFYETLMAYKIR